MRPYSLREIAGITGGRIAFGDEERTFTKVSIDSRKTGPGDLFVAIVGERADAHDFVGDVREKGTGGAVCEHPVDGLSPGPDGFGLLIVPSTIGALRDLSTHYRRELSLEVIGVTGSVGKTGTKDFLASVLSHKFPTYGNPGNLNSHIGLPLAVLGIDAPYRYAVLEMAMRKRGEIRELCEISRPVVGVLTDISASHIGVLGSIDEIAHAKAEILEALPRDGLAVMCGDNEHIRRMSHKATCRKVFYGLAEGNDVRAVDLRSLGGDGSSFTAVYKNDRFPLVVRVPGAHMVQNSLAAVAVGLEFGMSPNEIREGLENAQMSPMRLEVRRQNGLTVINDAYNASPKSTRAALDLLEEIKGERKIAVLGDMLEMGFYGPEAHREIGKYAAGKADILVAAGELGIEIVKGWNETGSGKPASWFGGKEEAQEHLGKILRRGDVCLVKASRGMGFESIVAFLDRLGEL
ncbi:MAG TPA: UDP-N-acetylmuramoyl-tripeptide--D-alanyl-D-alanine ligase [Firmicutes bacterium]|nr:UDP-N-acetylmuramoyl-tripeptide--D-alanyl-D-alanine ligase [Candidatus Fermentithermobacillaceae bacterium]